MKGVVFTEFLEMVEEHFSIDLAEEIISGSGLASRGAYTSVGTYDHRELLKLVTRLGDATGRAVPELVRDFGKHLFGRFTKAYPALFEGFDSAFDFISRVEDCIHVEVRKLYPDAELPRFEIRSRDRSALAILYRSERPLADLAEGLIAGCAEYFGEEIDIRRESHSGGTLYLLTSRAGVPLCST